MIIGSLPVELLGDLKLRLLARQHTHNILCHHAHPHQTLLGMSGHVRRADKIIQPKQRMVPHGRFRLKDIGSGPRDLPGLQRLEISPSFHTGPRAMLMIYAVGFINFNTSAWIIPRV